MPQKNQQGETNYELLSSTQLAGPFPSTAKMIASDLWNQHEGPVLLMVVRRLGGPLCRQACADVHSHAEEFKELGVKLVAVATENSNADDFLSNVIHF